MSVLQHKTNKQKEFRALYSFTAIPLVQTTIIFHMYFFSSFLPGVCFLVFPQPSSVLSTASPFHTLLFPCFLNVWGALDTFILRTSTELFLTDLFASFSGYLHEYIRCFLQVAQKLPFHGSLSCLS